MRYTYIGIQNRRNMMYLFTFSILKESIYMYILKIYWQGIEKTFDINL